MGSYEFRYLEYNKQLYPVVPVSLTRLGHPVDTNALIDSGSSTTVFKPEFAALLGLHVERGRKISILGIDGEPLNAHAFSLALTIPGTKEEMSCDVCFSRNLRCSFNILGRDSIFRYYDVLFKEKEKLVVLHDRA